MTTRLRSDSSAAGRAQRFRQAAHARVCAECIDPTSPRRSRKLATSFLARSVCRPEPGRAKSIHRRPSTQEQEVRLAQGHRVAPRPTRRLRGRPDPPEFRAEDFSACFSPLIARTSAQPRRRHDICLSWCPDASTDGAWGRGGYAQTRKRYESTPRGFAPGRPEGGRHQVIVFVERLDNSTGGHPAECGARATHHET